MTKKYLSLFIIILLFGNPVSSQPMEYDPDLWLPDTVFVALGNTIELYNNNVAFIRLNDGSLSFTWTHEKGYSDSEKFYWTANQPGNVKLKITCFHLGERVDSASTILKVVNKTDIVSKNLLSLGNSLTAGGYQYQIPQILTDLNFVVNAIGTQGTTYKHEGYPGWFFQTFLGTSSPFYILNTINFKEYIENNNLQNPDIIRISLGINDCFGTTPIDNITENATKLIDTISRDYPNSLIIIALPTLCESTGSGWIASYGDLSNFEPYILRVRELWKRLYNKYSFGKYKTNIQVSCDGLAIDRENGYPSDNGIHPNATGHSQLIRGFSNTLNYYANKFFTDINDTVFNDNPFKIFPNPLSDNFEISFTNAYPEKINIFNGSGQLVLTQEVTDDRVIINTNNLAPGFYICNMKIGNRYYSQKILKLR
ncbi:MAG: SGNH/GDSL hydrolase family protein [Bacteroidales bacterium]|nr:SGNH/GDSL hydrolase family protein [Bacteroidales bacterium]